MRNPFKKRETTEEEIVAKHKPSVDEFGKAKVLISIDSMYTIANDTVSPDQLLSLTTMLMDYTAKTIEKYSEVNPEEENKIKYQDIMDKMVMSTHVYRLVESGMDANEAMKVVGIEGHCHEIPKDNS